VLWQPRSSNQSGALCFSFAGLFVLFTSDRPVLVIAILALAKGGRNKTLLFWLGSSVVYDFGGVAVFSFNNYCSLR
jgi:hypothetical protein